MEEFEMSFHEAMNKTKAALARIGRRNLIVFGALLVIGGAVYLNVVLFAGGREDGYDGYDAANGMSSTTGTLADGTGEREEDYFVAVSISRQQARDEAPDVLQTVVDSSDVTEDDRNQAYAAMTQIARNIEAEANIETLIRAKGFEDCVAVISDGSVSVVVPASGETLLQSEMAQINEIVYTETGVLPASVKLIVK
jgi:stage III sporulation protein AH